MRFDQGEATAVSDTGTCSVRMPGGEHPYRTVPVVAGVRVHQGDQVIVMREDQQLPVVIGTLGGRARDLPNGILPRVSLAQWPTIGFDGKRRHATPYSEVPSELGCYEVATGAPVGYRRRLWLGDDLLLCGRPYDAAGSYQNAGIPVAVAGVGSVAYDVERHAIEWISGRSIDDGMVAPLSATIVGDTWATYRDAQGQDVSTTGVGRWNLHGSYGHWFRPFVGDVPAEGFADLLALTTRPDSRQAITIQRKALGAVFTGWLVDENAHVTNPPYQTWDPNAQVRPQALGLVWGATPFGTAAKVVCLSLETGDVVWMTDLSAHGAWPALNHRLVWSDYVNPQWGNSGGYQRRQRTDQGDQVRLLYTPLGFTPWGEAGFGDMTGARLAVRTVDQTTRTLQVVVLDALTGAVQGAVAIGDVVVSSDFLTWPESDGRAQATRVTAAGAWLPVDGNGSSDRAEPTWLAANKLSRDWFISADGEAVGTYLKTYLHPADQVYVPQAHLLAVQVADPVQVVRDVELPGWSSTETGGTVVTEYHDQEGFHQGHWVPNLDFRADLHPYLLSAAADGTWCVAVSWYSRTAYATDELGQPRFWGPPGWTPSGAPNGEPHAWAEAGAPGYPLAPVTVWDGNDWVEQWLPAPFHNGWSEYWMSYTQPWCRETAIHIRGYNLEGQTLWEERLVDRTPWDSVPAEAGGWGSESPLNTYTVHYPVKVTFGRQRALVVIAKRVFSSAFNIQTTQGYADQLASSVWTNQVAVFGAEGREGGWTDIPVLIHPEGDLIIHREQAYCVGGSMNGYYPRQAAIPYDDTHADGDVAQGDWRLHRLGTQTLPAPTAASVPDQQAPWFTGRRY